MNYEYTTSLRLTTPRQTLGCVQKKLPDIFVHAVTAISKVNFHLTTFHVNQVKGKLLCKNS